MKKMGIVLISILVLIFITYAGYRIYKHEKRLKLQQQSSLAKPSFLLKPGISKISVYKMAKNSTLGAYLTDTNGMTLYTFTKDTPSVSNCVSKVCVENWLAYVVSTQSGVFQTGISAIKRNDGIMQYTWKQMPLYRFIGDKKPGETNGEGLGKLWFVAK